MEIKEISTFEFLLLYVDKFPKIMSRYCTGMYSSSIIFMLIFDGNPIGAALFQSESEYTVNMNYIYVNDNKRKCGIGKFLFSEAVKKLSKKGIKTVYTRAVINNNYIYHIFESYGLSSTDESMIVRSSIESDNEVIWNKYISKKRLYVNKWSKMNDVYISSFASVSDNIKDIIFDMNNNDFPKELDSRDILYGKCGRFDENISFIAYKENKPVAYTMISAADKNALIFSQVSTSDKYKGTGAFIVPLVYSMDKIFQSEYKIICYTILKGNYEMNKVFDNLFYIFPSVKKKQIYFKKEI